MAKAEQIIPKEWYTKTFAKKEKKTIGGLTFAYPDLPDDSLIIGHDSASEKQYFTPNQLPKGWNEWNSVDIERYVQWQWHRRLNGEWQYINGKPYYIPGPALPFFEYWTTRNGTLPSFRIEALHFFWQWYLYVEPNPNCFGLFDLKARRLGDTEKSIYIVWELCTRYRNATGGMQSYTDTEGFKNYTRLKKGHTGMPYFFKPKHSGSDRHSLQFKPPSEIMSKKKIVNLLSSEGHEAQLDFLNSEITYEATTTGKYDGDQLNIYHLDEIWKINPKQLDAREQWKNARKFLSWNNEETIIGKAILSSTVEKRGKHLENTGQQDSIEMANYFWDNSDPNDLNENGRTYTGLARTFRGFEYTAKIDEYGFHQIESARKFRDEKLRQFREKGDIKSIMDEYRKAPDSPEEALADTSEKCILFPEYCSERLHQIRYNKGRYGQKEDCQGNSIRPKVVEGELVWKDGIPMSQVIWMPSRGGKWHISQQPIRTNANRIMSNKGKARYTPQNMAFYRMGCDPYDARSTVGRGSDGAFVVKRRLNLLHEVNPLQFDDAGEVINSEDMITNQIVCDYKFRHPDPYMFYDDVLKTCWYYGVMVFPELDKPGLVQYAFANKFENFIQVEPNQLLNVTNNRKARKGRKAGTDTIAQYVSLLKHYVYHNIWGCHHPRVIKDWKTFEVDKRTKHDLTVACGFMELADMDERYKDEEQEEEQKTWGESLYQYYD